MQDDDSAFIGSFYHQGHEGRRIIIETHREYKHVTSSSGIDVMKKTTKSFESARRLTWIKQVQTVLTVLE